MINQKTKKAQMKIQQMSFMLIAVFMFLALVGMIVVTIMLSHMQSTATALREQNAKLMASRIANSPEFSCGDIYGGIKTDCVDLDKVMALKKDINDYMTSHSNFWGIYNIEIRTLYPPIIINGQSKEKECTISTYPNCNYINIMGKPSSEYDKPNFVAVCRKQVYKDKVVNKCELGQIIIRYEEATLK